MAIWEEDENKECLKYLDLWRQLENQPSERAKIIDKIKVQHNEDAIKQHMYYLDRVANGELTDVQKDQWLIGINKK